MNTQYKATIQKALDCIKESQGEPGQELNCNRVASTFCVLRIANEERGQEHFLILYLNKQHRLIEDRVEFHGTIDGASVYPRIIAKKALELDSSALILCHNHPSGLCKPSQSDLNITEKLKTTMKLFDISVLDHIIVAGTDTYSFAEHGII